MFRAFVSELCDKSAISHPDSPPCPDFLTAGMAVLPVCRTTGLDDPDWADRYRHALTSRHTHKDILTEQTETQNR